MAENEDTTADDKIIAAEHDTGPEEATEDSLANLREQLATEKAARVAAETNARSAIATADRATGDTHAANLHLVNSTIGRFKNEQETLKAQYRDAMSASNFDAAAEINQAMSDNSAKLLQLENGKDELERNPPRAEVSRTVTDPVEAFAAALTPRSAEWVRKHPQYVTDPRLNQKMIAAHNFAVADGFVADTDAYFAEVETILKPRGSAPEVTRTQDDDAFAGAATVVAKRGAPAAAPVSRSGNAAGTRTNSLTLTPAMREAARASGQTDDEYAKNYLALKREGKIGTGR